MCRRVEPTEGRHPDQPPSAAATCAPAPVPGTIAAVQTIGHARRATPLLLAACAAACGRAPAPRPRMDSVDPRIGTGGAGFGQANTFVGATAPFGLVKVGPDTTGTLGRVGFAHTSGYWYEDRTIEGFSHIHLSGTGVADYGSILFMPIQGMDATRTAESGYQSAFTHDTESVRPGYYAVTLKNGGIRVELTATERAAVHRYTFPRGAGAAVVIDLSHALGSGKTIDGAVTVDSERAEVAGWTMNAGNWVGEGGAFPVYFVAKFDTRFIGHGTFSHGALSSGAAAGTGGDLGAYLEFRVADGASIEARVGISFVDLDGARGNLDEVRERGFDAVRRGTEGAWERALGVVDVEGGTDAERRIFYTGLYHALLMPTLFTDGDGRYVGLDRKVHRAEGFRYHTDFSLWDTYRTLHSLLVLVAPDRQVELVRSLLAMLDQGGVFPRWPLATLETGTMVGSPADIVIAETYRKGLTDFDVERAYRAMVETASGPPPPGAAGSGRDGIAECLAVGYCPADRMKGSVALTLEYAHADFAISELARALDKEGEARSFAERAKAYRRHWDPAAGFLRPRTSTGAFVGSLPFDPLAFTDDYVEGNAWHYLFMAPHDPSGLVGLFGSPDAVVAKLDELFEASERDGKTFVEGTNLRMPDRYYWHGNEPDMHTAYVYAVVGRPDPGARWIRWVAETKYSDRPDGLDGNDDCGTLSAWYVFTAMGFYPVPGSDRYVVGSPIFSRSTIHLPASDFVIEAPGASPENRYVESADLNGVPLDTAGFHHSDLARGGGLVLRMGPRPTGWGRASP